MTEPSGMCLTCGAPFDGIALVDGFIDGKPAGWAQGTCSRCEAAAHPYRRDPFGEKLRRRRIDCRMTLREAAELLEMDFVQMSGIESGRFAPPSLREQARWLAWLTEGGNA